MILTKVIIRKASKYEYIIGAPVRPFFVLLLFFFYVGIVHLRLTYYLVADLTGLTGFTYFLMNLT